MHFYSLSIERNLYFSTKLDFSDVASHENVTYKKV